MLIIFIKELQNILHVNLLYLFFKNLQILFEKIWRKWKFNISALTHLLPMHLFSAPEKQKTIRFF